MSLFYFIRACYKVWRALRTNHIIYLRHAPTSGVPTFCILAARDREAWRVTQFAIESEFSNLKA
jgi:hypothetical protein